MMMPDTPTAKHKARVLVQGLTFLALLVSGFFVYVLGWMRWGVLPVSPGNPRPGFTTLGAVAGFLSMAAWFRRWTTEALEDLKATRDEADPSVPVEQVHPIHPDEEDLLHEPLPREDRDP